MGTFSPWSWVRMLILESRSSKDQARVAILFSGGIDSTMLAYLADRYSLPEFEWPTKRTDRWDADMLHQMNLSIY